jgi:hypothetical protein
MGTSTSSTVTEVVAGSKVPIDAPVVDATAMSGRPMKTTSSAFSKYVRLAPLSLMALPLFHPPQHVQTALRRTTSCCGPLGVLPQGRCQKVV